MKPDYFLAGIAKSCTTSIYTILKHHPDISVPNISDYFIRNKELHFFDSKYNKGLEWYKNIFKNKNGIIGDHTPTYFTKKLAMGRIYDYNPNAKFIISLRNPVQRSWSQYKNTKCDYLDIEHYVNQTKQPAFITWSLYYKYFKHAFSLFSRKNFLILKNENFETRFNDEMNKIFKFLNLKPYKVSKVKSNVTPNQNKIPNKSKKVLKEYFKSYNKKLYKLLNKNFNWEKEL